MKLNKVHLAVAVTCFIVTSFVGDAYRAWAWSNGVNDLGLADAWTNIWGVPTALFFFSGIGWLDKGLPMYVYAITGAFGFIVYELTQPILGSGVRDVKDMIGSLVGAMLALCLLYVPAIKGESRSTQT